MRPLEAALKRPPAQPLSHLTSSRGSALRNPYLAGALELEELGSWALDAPTINWLEGFVARRRPRAIFEFGSGLSTLCLARFLQEAGRGPEPCIFSLEQDEAQVERTRMLAARHGMDEMISVRHAPLRTQIIAGRDTLCYDLPEAMLADWLGPIRPEMVLIDGPAGPDGCRWGTLPLVASHLAPGAALLLDDALRPGELDVAHRWQSEGRLDKARMLSFTPRVPVRGTYLLGKGLLQATVRVP